MENIQKTETTQPKPKKKRPPYRNQPLKAIVNAPIGPGGSYIPLLECCEGEVKYLVPDDVRIAFMNGLLEKAAERLSKM